MLLELHVRFYLVNVGIHLCKFDNCDSGQNHIYQRSEYSQQQRPLSFLMVEYPALKMRQFLAIERSHALGAFGFHLWILFAVQGKGANFVSFSWSVLMLVLRQEIGILTCLTFTSMNRLPWPSSSSQIFSGTMAAVWMILQSSRLKLCLLALF